MFHLFISKLFDAYVKYQGPSKLESLIIHLFLFIFLYYEKIKYLLPSLV